MQNPSKHYGQSKLQKTFLYFIYPVPPEIPSDERYFYDDIPRMTHSELQCELDRALHRLMLDLKPCPWLLERIDRLREAVGHAN